MTDGYYILDDGDQKGPFTFNELVDMEPDIHTRILSHGTNTWQDACDLPELNPYFESHGVYFPTGDNLASFWWRLAAYALDYVLLYFIMELIYAFLASRGITFKLESYNDLMKLSPKDLLILQSISSVPLILYNSICDASAMKGTFGKRMCGLVVVDADGVGLSFPNALLRGVGKALSVAFLCLGFVSIFFSQHHQAMHDYFAKCYVVKRN